MPTDAKRQAVTDLADLLRGSSALAVADYRGLTVSEMHTVRRSLRANGVSLKIAKNRLLKIAADEAGLAELKPMLEGPTAIAATSGDEVSLARALQDAFRPYKVVSLRGGLLAGQPVNAADLQRLATLPSREVLLARLAGGMAAPLTGMAGVLAANLRNLIGVLNAVVESKRETDVGSADVATEDVARAAATPPAPADDASTPEDAGAPEDAQAEGDALEAVADSTDVADAAEGAGTPEQAVATDEAPAEEGPADEGHADEGHADEGHAVAAEADSATDENPTQTD
jgi:large subunit ribosomal protein L10